MKEISYKNKEGKFSEVHQEVYKVVPNYPNYEVSTLGRVRNIRRNKVLQYNILKNGYARVDLGNEFGFKHKSVHRLVAELFLPNPDNKPYVNHKDGIKTNNCVTNLEWCTEQENTIHAVANNLIKVAEEHGNSKLTNKMVKLIPVLIMLGGSRRSIAESLGVSKTTIAKIISKDIYTTVNINIDLSNSYLPRGSKGKVFSPKEIAYLLDNTELT